MADSLYDDLRLVKKRDGLDDALYHMGFFSSDSPFGGLGSSDLSSTDSDNEDLMTGLTSQLGRSTIADCFKVRSLGSSPQSTLCTGWKRSTSNGIGPGQLSLTPASWAARAKLNKSSMAPPPHRQPSYVAEGCPDAGFYPQPQRVQQETITGVWSGEVKVHNRNRARNCDFFAGPNESGPRAECAGTGVFLPRPKLRASQTRKKPGCSVLLPARVVQALNLNLDQMVLPCAQNDGLGNGLLEHPQGLRPRPGTRNDIGLPQDWTY